MDNQPLTLFIPLTKVDAVRREVWGTLAAEEPDRGDEVMDYSTSKKNFEAWSALVKKVSGGRSLFNIRSMHQKIAAGKGIALNFDDVNKRVEIGVKVVDDNEWQKCVEGVYTGFSVGGKYGKRWSDPRNPTLTRYEAIPREGSLVDAPCIPSATFSLVKMADNGDLYEETRMFKIAEREDVSPKSGESKYGDVTYADPKNKKYPIDTAEHARAALSYFSMPKNREKYSSEDAATIMGRIHAAAKKFGIELAKVAEPDAKDAKTDKGGKSKDAGADIPKDAKAKADAVEGARDAGDANAEREPGDYKGSEEPFEKFLGDVNEHATTVVAALLNKLGTPSTSEKESIMDLEKLLADGGELQKGIQSAIGAALEKALAPETLEKSLTPIIERVAAEIIEKSAGNYATKGDLEKVVSDMAGALTKAFDAFDQPEPAKGAQRVVEKAAEIEANKGGEDALTKGLDLNKPTDLIKLAHRQGGTRVDPALGWQ